MRHWIAISLLSLFVATHTEVHEVLKIPGLMEHYWEHQSVEHTGWWAFISEHYLHGHHHEGEHHNHQELPFHGDHHCGGQTLQAKVAEQDGPSLSIPPGMELQLMGWEDHIVPRSGPADIWQPPRA